MYQDIKAILGPTNTGKTYLALERMMAYPSGIIGFPLRLLAKENYDRMVAIKGKQHVALITGEEKIIPPKARWFSCTVEAMPVHVPVDIIVIDEIQLCSDPDRGHIFTDRLLHCRGKQETIFLGSDIIQPILKRLIPEITIESRPRLSSLTYDGFTKLTKLPPRCAIVTFSAQEVYAIAEIIKRQKGGCAIIMGRLSPRTRNAQMELYQNKEVDYLIATDAIGMGLNMDVNHIAFVNLSKYDGRQLRNLYPTEIAQIAGRAGRGLQNGTFGTTANCHGMSEKIINSVENHLFDPLKQIYWRNHDLEFTNPIQLFRTLTQSSKSSILMSSQYASDLQTLSHYIQDTDILSLCTTKNKTELLWETCQIPDFKKLGNDYHARTCKQIFSFLIKQGHIPESWIHQQIQQINHPYGDIDTLMQRLASIRIYSYITAKNSWMESSSYWQAQTRDVEEQLSDALHNALMSKFVNQRSSTLIHHLSHKEKKDLFISFTDRNDIMIEGQTIGKIQGLSYKLQKHIPEQEQKILLKQLYKQSHRLISHKVHQLIHATDQEFVLDHESYRIIWENEPVAHIRKGTDLLHPEIILIQNDCLNQTQRELIIKRLKHYLDSLINRLFPLFSLSYPTLDIPPFIKGMIHQLYENGGLVWLEKKHILSKQDKRILKQYNIHYGYHACFIKHIFKEQPYKLRNCLLKLFYNFHNAPNLSPQNITYPHDPTLNQNALKHLGWMFIHGQWIRLDIAEKVTHKLHLKSRKFPVAFHKKDILPLRYAAKELIPFLKTLKLCVLPAQKPSRKQLGPPAPLLIASFPINHPNKSRKALRKKQPELNTQFAILKNLYHKHDTLRK